MTFFLFPILVFTLIGLSAEQESPQNYILYGDCIRLQHDASKAFLHYEQDGASLYLEGLSSDEVSGDPHEYIHPFNPYNQISWWQIYKAEVSPRECFGKPIEPGDTIILKHLLTNTLLAQTTQRPASDNSSKVICSPATSFIDSLSKWNIIQKSPTDKKFMRGDSILLQTATTQSAVLWVTEKVLKSKHPMRPDAHRSISYTTADAGVTSTTWCIYDHFPMSWMFDNTQASALIAYFADDFGGTGGLYNNQYVAPCNRVQDAPRMLHVNDNQAPDAWLQPYKYLAGITIYPFQPTHLFVCSGSKPEAIHHPTTMNIMNNAHNQPKFIWEKSQGNRSELIPDPSSSKSLKEECEWEIIPTLGTSFKLRHRLSKKYFSRHRPSFLSSKKYPEEREIWSIIYGNTYAQGTLFSRLLPTQSLELSHRESGGGAECSLSSYLNELYTPYFSTHWKISETPCTIAFSTDAPYGICLALSSTPSLYEPLLNQQPECIFIIIRKLPQTLNDKLGITIYRNSFVNSVMAELCTDYDKPTQPQEPQQYWIKIDRNIITFGTGDHIKNNRKPLTNMNGYPIQYTIPQHDKMIGRFIGFSSYFDRARISNLTINNTTPQEEKKPEPSPAPLADQGQPAEIQSPAEPSQSSLPSQPVDIVQTSPSYPATAMYNPMDSTAQQNRAIYHDQWKQPSSKTLSLSFNCLLVDQFMIALSSQPQTTADTIFVIVNKQDRTITLAQGLNQQREPHPRKKIYIPDNVSLETESFWITTSLGEDGSGIINMGTGPDTSSNKIVDAEKLPLNNQPHEYIYIGFGGFERVTRYSKITIR